MTFKLEEGADRKGDLNSFQVSWGQSIQQFISRYQDALASLTTEHEQELLIYT